MSTPSSAPQRPAAVAPAPRVDLLRAEAGIAIRLVQGLQQKGFDPRAWDSAESWLAALPGLQPPAALVTPASALPATGEMLERLALTDSRLASVLLVGYGGDEQRLPALLGGADLYLDALHDPQLGARLAGWIREQDTAPFRVMVIDDDAEGRLYCTSVLQRVGMQVEAYADPEQAIARVPEFLPDLVLVDLYMPGLDGVAVTRRLREQESAPLLPIVFLSGEERPAARFNALRLGADDFLVKPVRPRALIAAVRSRVKRARGFNRSLVRAEQDRGPRLRRGDFLAELERRLRQSEQGWEVLLAVRVDRASELRERFGLAGVYALERALAVRLEAVLAHGDRFSLWEELGFGVLLQRTERSEIEAQVRALFGSVRAQPFELGGEALVPGISIGMALPPQGRRQSDVERWIASAFAALSMAMRFGGDRAEGVLSRDPGALPPERIMVIHQALKDLPRGGGLRFEFQPLMRLRGERGSYALIAKLRDLRAPLQGYPRHEFLALAREQNQIATIDRMALFHAFEAIAEQRQRGRSSSILVPVDLRAFDARQFAWLKAELRRRPELTSDLRIELEAEALLDPQLQPLLERLCADGLSLAAASATPRVELLQDLLSSPVHQLRLPCSLIQQTDPEALALLIAGWQAQGKELLVDGVRSVQAVGGLWNLGIDFLQGDVLAAASPRLDFEGCEG
jgi:DNA-binding response OmpR family regulator/EAL domain-containing protein (putative c-di-GMP-specific phosphodiesterase class I)